MKAFMVFNKSPPSVLTPCERHYYAVPEENTRRRKKNHETKQNKIISICWTVRSRASAHSGSESIAAHKADYMPDREQP